MDIIKLPLDELDRIAHVHMDWSAQHALVSTVNGENYYFHMKSPTQQKPLKKLKVFLFFNIGLNE
jgi:hypothetical protein